MKKITKFVAFVAGITLFYSYSLAGGLSEFLWTDTPTNLLKTIWTGSASSIVISIIAAIIDLILYLSWVIAMFMVIYWGFRYITYFWSDDAEEEAKKSIIHWLVWLLVVIVSVLLLDNVKDFIDFLFWKTSTIPM